MPASFNTGSVIFIFATVFRTQTWRSERFHHSFRRVTDLFLFWFIYIKFNKNWFSCCPFSLQLLFHLTFSCNISLKFEKLSVFVPTSYPSTLLCYVPQSHAAMRHQLININVQTDINYKNLPNIFQNVHLNANFSCWTFSLWLFPQASKYPFCCWKKC